MQDEKCTTKPIEEVVDVVIDDEEPKRVLKVAKNLDQERFNELSKFLRANLDVFALLGNLVLVKKVNSNGGLVLIIAI